MTISWERFEGSTDGFAARLAFMSDPDEGSAATTEESASWGALQIWADGHNLSAHVSQGEPLQSTHWYLLPVLEWIAEHWNPLFHEERLPNRNVEGAAATALIVTRNAPALADESDILTWEEDWYEWHARHALRAARAGGLFPNVVIRRFRDSIEVSWDDEPLAGSPRGFRHSASHGVVYLPPAKVARPLYELLRSATDHLLNLHPESTRLTELRGQIDKLRLPDQHHVRLDWLAGLRRPPTLGSRLVSGTPADDMQIRWNEIVATLQETGDSEQVTEVLAVEESPLVISGSCHAALLFSSVAPTITSEDVRTLASVLVERYSRDVDTTELEDLSFEILPDPAIPDWEQGYELAEWVHERIDLTSSGGSVDIEGLLQRLNVTVISRRLRDRDIRACSIVGPHHQPTVVHNESSLSFNHGRARRFSMAHELCHLLFDRSQGQKLAIASGPWAPRSVERRANAFAAMFLMPTVLVQEIIAEQPESVEEPAVVAAIASRLQVGRHATIEHLYNLTLMSEVTRDELLARAQNSNSAL
ncbi:ImmA/IrrE family metallo-endopeptidase [Sphaerisporangium rhizosphaerae]|uniref:ImmA/IrrE family metallo-endopeptidase n=1 Tax=Sphaerisporangium rhizosphaerae TaxID=2269375 RepID=A0ABW2NZ40_9ACTN